jgi:hypothetical protein
MVQTHLTGAQVETYGRAIEAIVRERAADWDIHGWSFQGRSPHIRLVVKVTAKRLDKHRNLSIPLPEGLGGRLKVFVRATFARKRSPGAVPVSADSLAGGVIAPGASIVVDHGNNQREWAGIAAILMIEGGPHILTCGHAFTFGGSREKILVDPEEDAPIAELTTSYFHGRPRLDAAICKLNEHGVGLLEEHSKDAISWSTRFRRPRMTDNGKTAVFWATNPGSAGSYEAPISSYTTSDSILFGDGEIHDGFIEMPFIASGGDSGSLLSVNGSYYGICAGHVGDSTLFTPFARVMDRVRETHPEATLWTPRKQSWP